ncbi:esterase/lipase family protein [Collimonas pratensis]|uniref:Lipase n=1 Tax=Collimonas pratensis TaxID=279113 RepID=A0A127Q5L6_9BURK|nr:triacylglycerol lipase [Collimonas pratensis]AMP05105.1 lipase [Collimonas pratensis]
MKKTFLRYGLLASLLAVNGIGAAHAGWLDAAFGNPASTAASDPATSAATQYPVILVNGLFGTDDYLKGPSFQGFPYWYGIVEDLQRHGAKVYVASVRTIDGEAARGQDLLDFINKVAPGQKVNLIGHSQGGFTVRYVAQIAPDRVASVTTIGTPHWGAPLADVISGAIGVVDNLGFGTAVRAVLTPLASILGLIIQGNPDQDAFGTLGVLNSAGAAAFNLKYSSAGLGDPKSCASGASSQTIDGNVQQLYSWSGSAFRGPLPHDVSLTTVFGVPLDTALLLDGTTAGLATVGLPTVAFGLGDNDGMVPVCRSKFGQVIGTAFKWNHLDEVNQIAGILGGNAEDPVAVIRTHVERLKNAKL